MSNLDQSNIWDLATLEQKIALKKLEASQYESTILQVIDESAEDFEKIPEKLREALGV